MSDDKPWELVANCSYFGRVLDSMVKFDSNARKDTTVVVRFGVSDAGRGIRPNYQIEAPGRVLAISSTNHESDPNAPGDRYDDQELSAECFTFQDVQALFRRCLERASGKT